MLYSNYCLNNINITKITFKDLEDWFSKGSKATSSSGSSIYNLTRIPQKNLVNAQWESVETLTIPSGYATWAKQLTQGFRWVKTLTLPNHISTS